jgi:hypothetical protein
MITGFFLSLFYTVIMFFVNLLPVSSLPSDWTAALSAVWSYTNAANFLFPMSTFLTVLGLALTFHVTVLLWRLSVWIIHLARGK